MKDCLVTGGCGFIGSHLVEGLLARGMLGARAGRSEHRQTKRTSPGVGWARGISYVAASPGPRTFDQAVAGCDTVFHLAALALGDQKRGRSAAFP